MGMFVLSERSFWAMDRTKILKISFVFIFANNFGVFQPIFKFFFNVRAAYSLSKTSFLQQNNFRRRRHLRFTKLCQKRVK